nr:hypothetical protein [Tanacetum cinerariifolium]
VHLHDAALAPERLDEDGEVRLGRFAHVGAAVPEKNVFGYLLRNGRAAAHGLALGAVPVVLRGAPHAVEVKAVVQ